MAIVERFFSTAAAGAEDGTSWANRAALFSGGNWSSVITGFDFSGSDALRALIGPGSYSCSQSLASGLFANPPTAANLLFLEGYDGSNRIAPEDGGWVSAEPAWDDSGLPVITTTTNIITLNLQSIARFLKFTASGVNGPVVNLATCDWVSIVQATSNASAGGLGSASTRGSNCIVRMEGSTYGYGLALGNWNEWDNVRIEGNSAASSGVGILSGGTASGKFISRMTVFNHPGDGIFGDIANASTRIHLNHSILANNGGVGLLGSATASQTVQWYAIGNMITGNGGYGINAQSSRVVAATNRLRNNTSGNFNGFGNYPTDLDNETGAGTDADEYVNAAGGDFRIKNTSSLWGKGYGVADEPASGGSGGGGGPLVI